MIGEKPVFLPHRPFSILALLVFSLTLLASCGREAPAEGDESPPTVRLSDQFGLGYAPIEIARQRGLFEDAAPGVRFEWITMGNAAAIREAMLARKLDGGFMGIPPYLIGKDRGMEWTAVRAVSEARLGLVVTRDGVAGIEDIPADLRIALPQPGSIQHILLAMAAERRLGNAEAFDHQLVTMSHPDGMNALLSGTEIEAHFTSPPYLQMELQSGRGRVVLEGTDAFEGGFTFIIMVFSDTFAAEYPDTVRAIAAAIDQAASWMGENPAEAAALLAEGYGLDAGMMAEMLRSGDLNYGGGIRGMERFRDFMEGRGYLDTHLDDDHLILR